ncbi:phospholipase D gamma 1-like [Vicia villosa]|uniref:phospholipase D gamma 1-like n=1 Tax=Vicia villosa TaxID=3911 RepID=UPI00273AB938|nr:phospholipase D gamma 1-like [Vicia villosa]
MSVQVKVVTVHATNNYFVTASLDDTCQTQVIGALGIPVENLCNGSKLEGVFPILNTNGKPFKTTTILSLSIQYTPVDKVEKLHFIKMLMFHKKRWKRTYSWVKRQEAGTIYSHHQKTDVNIRERL